MRRLKLTVGINTKLNRGHIVHGEEALILPCLARSDIDMQASGRQSHHGRRQHVDGACVERSRRAAEPGAEIRGGDRLRHGARNPAGQRHRLGRASKGTTTLIRDKIEAVFPVLFADFNAPDARPRRLPFPHRAARPGLEDGDRHARTSWYRGRRRRTPDRESGDAVLTTIRSHDQYNTTIYSLNDRYRGVFGGRMVVFMNEQDMADRRHRARSLVELESLAGGDVRRTATRLQGAALQHPARLDRRLLPRNQWIRNTPSMAVYGLAAIFLLRAPGVVFCSPPPSSPPSSPPVGMAACTTGSSQGICPRRGSSPSGPSSR